MKLSGGEAIARALVDGGIRSAYSFPGSPATKISLTLEREGRVRHAWCVNEAVAATMALAGAALEGWGTACVIKHVGVNVALDALATGAQISEYGSPCVIVEGIDARPKTSQNVQDNRALWFGHARVVALEPGSPQECYDLTRWAVELSAIARMPVVVRAEERVLGASAEVAVREAPTLTTAPAWKQAAPLVSTAPVCHFHTQKREWLLARVAPPLAITPGEGRCGYLVAGQLGAIAVQGAPTMRLGACNPIPLVAIRAFAERLDELIVVEEGLPLLAETVATLAIDAKLGSCRPEEVLPAPSAPLKIYELPDPELMRDKWPEAFEKARELMPVFPVQDPRLGLFKKLRTLVRGGVICTDPGVTGVLGIRDGWVDLKLQMGCAAPSAGALADAGVPAIAVMGDTNFYHSELAGVMDNAIARRDVLHVLVVNRKSEMTAGVRTPYLGDAALEQMLRGMGVAVLPDLEAAAREKGPRVVIFRLESDVTADA
jgi:indolepyruvate ferredoxin oxidoreductase alpha subunit